MLRGQTYFTHTQTYNCLTATCSIFSAIKIRTALLSLCSGSILNLLVSICCTAWLLCIRSLWLIWMSKMRYFNIPQWIRRRLSRRCPSRVWLTVNPGSFWSSVRDSLYGINYKAGLGQKEEARPGRAGGRVVRGGGRQHLRVLRLSPAQLCVRRGGGQLLAAGCWSPLARWVQAASSARHCDWDNETIRHDSITLYLDSWDEDVAKKYSLDFSITLRDKILTVIK